MRPLTSVLLVGFMWLPACQRGVDQAPPSLRDGVQAALNPATWVAALRAHGGAHVTGRARWSVTDSGRGREEAITTTTTLDLDGRGNYHLHEDNDRDGGRDVVRFGPDLAVALRYGRLMRHPAREPEMTRLLEEAVGHPNAAWELASRFARVEPVAANAISTAGLLGSTVVHVSIAKAAQPAPVDERGTDQPSLRAWRRSVVIDELEGELTLLRDSQATTMPVSVRLQGRYHGQRDERPIQGAWTVELTVDALGRTPPIGAPAAQDLSLRQRTILEERALLGEDKPAPGTAPGSSP